MSHTPRASLQPLQADGAPVRDRRGRSLHDLRISVTDRCNMRCTYCMPAEEFGEHYAFLPREALLSFEEIARIATACARLGTKKLRITGGEPLLRKDLPSLVRLLRAIPGIEDIALTTNGLLLQRLAIPLKEAGLDRVTVSLDSLDEDNFLRISGNRGSLQEVLNGIAAAQTAGFAQIKINMVVMRGVNDHEVCDLAERFRGTGIIPRFIEFMDVGTLNNWELAQVLPSHEAYARIAARWPLKPLEARYRGEVAERYAYEDGAGEVGFISSVTQPFCGACSRLRLSADGALYTCLFAATGMSIKAALRGGAADGEIQDMIAALWRARNDRYSELRSTGTSMPKVEMYHIGG
jgi:cyclic pyranopterin phosphate synthase